MVVVAVGLTVLSGCGDLSQTNSTSSHPGWDELVALTQEIGDERRNRTALQNLTTLVGEAQLAECMRDEEFDYQLAPFPSPDLSIDTWLREASTSEQELAFFATRDPDSFGLSRAFFTYGNDIATRWAREWIVAQNELNDAVWDIDGAGDIESDCYRQEPPAQAWLWTEEMDVVGSEFSLMLQDLRYDLDLDQCGETLEDSYGDLAQRFSNADDYPTADRPAGPLWSAVMSEETSRAIAINTCVLTSLDAGDSSIGSQARRFRGRYANALEVAKADWEETHELLELLVTGQIEVDDARIAERKAWVPEWGLAAINVIDEASDE